ncbi:MAG: uroporphyrinogen-III C-methyltransferase [Burkholderiaceae bacterium]
MPEDPPAAAPPESPAAARPTPPSPVQQGPRFLGWAGAGLALLALAAIGLAWTSQQRVKLLEQQLVARQQQTQSESGEALVLARQSQDTARESAARMALLEARLAEAAVQRSQLDELIQSLSRSRDENLLADIEAALRIAQQQAALTGSLEPLLAALRQADERLARHNQPRLERVRRAVLRDLERVRGVSQVDVATLVIRLDEVARQVDDLPLVAVAHALQSAAPSVAAEQAVPASGPASPKTEAPAAAGAGTGAGSGWSDVFGRTAGWVAQGVAKAWGEVRSLIRITRIDAPESVLVSPDQQFFLRENLKLRLLNARLALLSRQFDVAQSDLRDAQRTLERYFDPSSRRVVGVVDLVRQVGQLSRQVSLPRPDETLAALAAVNSLR